MNPEKAIAEYTITKPDLFSSSWGSGDWLLRCSSWGVWEGVIEGEYWEKEELFCLHVHIAMPAKYTGKLEKLAYQFYNAERHNGMFSKPKVTMQVTKSKVRLLNYLLKTYWVKKASGKKRDTKDRHRIKGRPHTMYLLWLDQYRISNLRILHNIQFNSKGGIVSSW